MLSITLAIVPVFALILLGYLASRMNILGPQAPIELNRFVVFLALPAMLFEATAGSPIEELWQPGLLGAFLAGSLTVGAIAVAAQRMRGRPLTEAVIGGLNACYANHVYLGLPISLVLIGPAAAPLVGLIAAASVAGLFILAVIIIEIGRHASHGPFGMIGKVAGSLARNPLFISPIAGTIWSASGLGVPAGIDSFMKLLAAAASPCALVALGLFLALPSRSGERLPGATVPGLAFLKLVVHPAVTAFLAFKVFGLPHQTALLATLISSLPTGTGPSMVAELYKQDMRITSRTIVLTTVLGIVTVSIVARLLGISAS